MADFSHIEAIGIQLQIDRICKGERLGDHELLEIVRYIDPPLLNPEEMDIVANELDESRSRKRGRPAGMIAPRKLMQKILGSIRSLLRGVKSGYSRRDWRMETMY